MGHRAITIAFVRLAESMNGVRQIVASTHQTDCGYPQTVLVYEEVDPEIKNLNMKSLKVSILYPPEFFPLLADSLTIRIEFCKAARLGQQ